MLNIFLGSEAAFSPPASDEYNYSQIWPLRSRWKLNPAFLVLSCTSVTNVGSTKTRRKVTSENGCRQASMSESYFNDIFHYSAKLPTLLRRHTRATNGCWIFLHRLDSKKPNVWRNLPPQKLIYAAVTFSGKKIQTKTQKPVTVRRRSHRANIEVLE